jgi:glycosyltransferase involved in cell wall biosynthesis
MRGANGRGLVRRRFGWDRIARQVLRVYEEAAVPVG